MRFFALLALATAKLSTHSFKDIKKAPSAPSTGSIAPKAKDADDSDSGDNDSDSEEPDSGDDSSSPDADADDFQWEESNGDERHEKYHCEGLTNSFYRMSLKLRRQGDVPLAEKMLLPFQALHL